MRWLELFKETLEAVCPDIEHVDAFYNRASNMARVMTSAIGGFRKEDVKEEAAPTAVA